ncbi:MAG: tripartite tricarboxylate transporter substrate binding protein [Betaproteobacteria bacterium]|nr:tripartite tricarboxylate transporter substrate binding protein [Betaproteobacteria bacterium]
MNGGGVMRMAVRKVITLAYAALALGGPAFAQGFPTKPIRLVVPLAPGGGGDLVSRMIAQKISEPLGQPVVVDNRPGGSTIIGTELVARSAPDGYTLVMATSSHGINPSLYKLPFDPVKDFSGIAFIATSPMMLTVHPSVPVKTVKELVAFAKRNPGKLNYGSSGIASIVHLAAELLSVTAGINMVHIPYKGTGPALNDLIAGQIDLMFASPIPTIPHVKSGRLRAVAMASQQRLPAMPDLPTVAESGFPGFQAASYYIVLGPANIPAGVVNRLSAHIIKATQAPDIRNRLITEGGEVVGGGPAQAMAHIESEIARWKKVVDAAHIKAE